MSFFSIFFIFLIFDNIYSNIHIRFYRYLPIKKEPKNLTLEEFINYRVENIYKTEISLGNPPQDIPGFLETNEDGFYVSNSNCFVTKYYDKDKSKTFINGNFNTTFNDSLFFYTSFYSTNYYKEIENYTISNLNNISEPFCFHIGLQLFKRYGDINIITGLHKKKYINSYYYYYKIYSEDELYLIMDVNIDDKKYINYNYIKPIKVLSIFYAMNKWGLNFEYLIFEKNNLHYQSEIKGEFDFNFGCIKGTSYFKKLFGNYLIKNGISVQAKIIKNNNIYFFDKNMKGIEYIKNISLRFYHKELNYEFILDFNDLFLEKDNGYYFLIIFDTNYNYLWKFGIPFLKKYNFIYNHDSKLLGFNCSKNSSDIRYEKKKNNNESIIKDIEKKVDINNLQNKNIGMKIFLIIFLSIVFIILLVLFFGIYIGKKIFGIRKTKVNELLELYDYSSNQKNSDKIKI